MKGLYYYNALSNLRLGQGAGYPTLKKMYGWFYQAASVLDRTQQMITPVRSPLYHRCRLPELRPSRLNYRECCDHRALELWNLSDQLQVPISIMWSGGLDSTRMVVSFLENFPQGELEDKVQILTNEFAKLENPKFYQNHILPNFKLISSEFVPWMFDGSTILVTGEFNDQVFGSDVYRVYFMLYNEYFNQPLSREGIFAYLQTKISDTRILNYIYDCCVASAERYGVVLEKNSDWWWWWATCFKWQYIYLRILTLAAPGCWPKINETFMQNYLQHFYATDDFQLWSIHNPQIRYYTKWMDYKAQARQEIYDFDKNEDYFQNKSKKGSLASIFYQRKIAEAIDEDFNFYETLDPSQWYEPNNTLKQFD